VVTIILKFFLNHTLRDNYNSRGMWIWAPQLLQPWNHLETFENENSRIASKSGKKRNLMMTWTRWTREVEQEKMTILFKGEDVCGGINLVIIWTSFIAQSM
jgi:hypothetical protein